MLALPSSPSDKFLPGKSDVVEKGSLDPAAAEIPPYQSISPTKFIQTNEERF